MKILCLDTSAKTASAAVVENNRILAESSVNTGLTHSQTVMPMMEGMLSAAKISLQEIDLLAVSHGPGSFTGIRIGIGAVKGMAQGLRKPCLGISTLEGLAYNYRGLDGFVCPVMDARCGQVYTALFQGKDGTVLRLREDEALPIAELETVLAELSEAVTLVGDGAELCFRTMNGKEKLRLAPPQMRLQRASSVGFAAEEMLKTASPLAPGDLMPVYLRLPQAERELLKKEGNAPQRKDDAHVGTGK